MLKVTHVLPTLALLLAALDPAQSAGPWMAEEDLKSTFAGTTIDGHYQSGRTFTERYDAQGRVEYRDEVRKSGGRWTIVAGSFCTIYDDDPTGGCFRVARTGPNCFEFYFIARTEDEASRPRDPDWTARGWIAQEVSTCTERADV